MSRQLSEFKMRHMLANQWAPHTSAISACKVSHVNHGPNNYKDT
jgi:hypothetical protein